MISIPDRPDADIRLRDLKLRERFGISVDDYDEMLLKQHGVCAICGGYCASGRRLAVDHCHETGRVRGLLCARCNIGLGFFDKDGGDLLLSAVEYLYGWRP